MTSNSVAEPWREPDASAIDAAANMIVAKDSGELLMPKPGGRHPSSWRWGFDGAAMDEPKLRFLYEYWQRLRADKPAPLASAIDPLDLRPALGFVLLLDILEDGFDARYRLYGTGVSEKAGRDWTGARVSEMNRIARTDMALFYRATYLAAYRRTEPLFTFHASPPWLSAESWRRVILPLADASGSVIRFMVGNIPIGWRPLDEEREAEQKAHLRGPAAAGK